MKDYFKFHAVHNKGKKIDLQFLDLTNSNQHYRKTDVDGLFGLGVSEKENSLLQQLKEQKVIHHLKFAVYISESENNLGHIKLGGYDSHAFMNGVRQMSFELDTADMSVPLSKFKLEESTIEMSSKGVTFDPSFIGFHLPEQDFAKLGSALDTLFEVFLDREAGQVACDTKDMLCFVEHDCDKIRENMGHPLKVEFELKDSTGSTF